MPEPRDEDRPVDDVVDVDGDLGAEEDDDLLPPGLPETRPFDADEADVLDQAREAPLDDGHDPA
jgi:hypothetical protein